MAGEPLKPEGEPRPPDSSRPGVAPREARLVAQVPRIPGYRIEGLLGRGSSGVVYRARQLSVDRAVALKVLDLPAGQAGQRATRRLQREARTAARLAHPNIISAIDMGQVDEETWWYAMELVEGESLAARLERGPLGERTALKLFLPLCEALVHLAEHGVVHRDVKPANVLIDAQGRARLVDLGLAVADDDPLVTQGGGTLGTPHYISPEQARDPSAADAQSDVWSFGATLFHALCGRPPFAGRGVAEILAAVLHARVPDPQELAPRLSRGMALVVRKCLSRDRETRYSAPGELLADLERLRERRPPQVEARRLEPVARSRKPFVRGALIALVALALLGAATWKLLADARAEDGVAAGPGEEARRLEALSEEVRAHPERLAEVLADLVELRAAGALEGENLPRYRAVYESLFDRLERELWILRREVEAESEALLRRRDFGGARSLLDAGLTQRLLERTGFVPGSLPGRAGPVFAAWQAQLGSRVADSWGAAQAAFREAVSGFVERSLAPRVEQALREHRWRSARALVERDPREWLADAGADPTGLEPAAVEAVLDGARRKLAEARARIEADWRAADGELLRWVRAEVARLGEALEQRQVGEAAELLRGAWARARAERGIVDAEVPLEGPELARESYLAGLESLGAREAELVREDAELGFRELERELAPLWAQRRYRELERAWSAELDEPWRAPVRAAMEARAAEAALLGELLERVAATLVARDGERIDLRVGASVYSGVLDCGPDPLQRGFHLGLGGGRSLAFALRPGPEVPAGAIQLGPEALERLGGLPLGTGADAGSERELLARAFLREREGDPLVARAILEGGGLVAGEPLVEELRRRVEDALSARRSAAEERAREARTKLNLVRRESLHGDRERIRRRVDELLHGYADVLDASELEELRRLRAEQLAPPRQASEAEFRALFGPDELSLSDFGRVQLGWRFLEAPHGAWESGEWRPDGRGWIAPAPAASDAAMLEGAAPRLLLRDPLALEAGPLEVELELEEPEGVRPELVLFSAAGYHAVLGGAKDGRPPRVLLDVGEPAALVARLRGGEGREFAGLRAGATHLLRLRVHQTRGTASLSLDGRVVAEARTPSPAGTSGSAHVGLRSLEPVRLVSARLDAPRR